ncbi:MAG: PAS domain-containing protein [Candidatus Obscuribacterales bacterium]|nr:PAS domain-containing protein [Candidatus Obscuribacterales bacterium]
MSRLSDLSIRSKGWLLVGVPLLCELVVLAGLAFLLDESEKEAAKESRSRAIIECTSTISRTMSDSGTTILLYWMTHDDKYKERLEELLAEGPNALKRLKELCKDNKAQMELLAEVDKSSARGTEMMQTLKTSIEQGGTRLSGMSVGEMRAEAKQAIKNLTGQLYDFEQLEKKRTVVKPKTQQYFRNLIKLGIVGGVIFNIVIAVVIALMFTREILSRLGVLSQNTLRLAKGEELLPQIKGRDELGKLDLVFRKMASDLTDAYSAVKEREDHLRSIYENVPVGLLVVNSSRDHEIESYNPGTAQLLGHDIKGKSLDMFLEAPNSQTEMQSKPILINDTNGREHFVQLKSAAFQAGEEARNLVMLIDVTEQHKLAEMKREFVAMLSHDLRSPLTSVQMFLGNLIKGYYGQLSEEALHSSRKGHKSVERLVDLVSDLLDLEMAEEGMMVLSRSEEELYSIFGDSIDAVESLADSTGVTLDCKETSIRINCDRKRLIRVMVNLLSNAVKFSNEGDSIQVTAAADREFVEVHVVDEGPGIPAEDQQTIFQRFKQSESGRERGGSGLGLANCKAIVEAHGGTIGVTSELGKGSDFWFRLPIKISGDSQAATAAPMPSGL